MDEPIWEKIDGKWVDVSTMNIYIWRKGKRGVLRHSYKRKIRNPERYFFDMKRKRAPTQKEINAARKRAALSGYQVPRSTALARPLIRAPLPAAFTPARVGETKAVDIAATTYPFRLPATATGVALLNGIQNGAAFYNRVGSRIEMKNLHIRGLISNVATDVQGSIRMIIVYDRQPKGALPVIADVLQVRTQTGAATTTGISQVNLDNRDRFSILRDIGWWTPPCTNTVGVLTNGPNFPGNDDEFECNIFLKLKGLGTHFSSSSSPTTIADIATGALYVFFVSSVSDSTWQASLTFRLRYNDV